MLLPVLSALEDGYEVYFITDASGGASREAHDMAVQRMIQAGAVPTTTWSYVSELQRDWSREATAGAHLPNELPSKLRPQTRDFDGVNCT